VTIDYWRVIQSMAMRGARSVAGQCGGGAAVVACLQQS